MKKELLRAAITATLCAAAGGAFADQPVDKEGPDKQPQWDLQQYITVCSNNGRGNNQETVTTGLNCLKFVNGNELEAPENVNTEIGEDCADGPDCDPKPAD